MALKMQSKVSMETTEARAKVYDILKGFSTAMFVTIGPSGRPESRPMQVARVDDEDGDVWFFTGRGGALAEEVKEEPVVLLVFQNDTSAYLSLRGKARVIEDVARIREYWKEAYRVWFPGGPSDSQLALVGVKPIDAEFWDNRGTNKLEYMFEAAKAYLSGEKPDTGDADKHARTNL
jgi:general stress protein 26